MASESALLQGFHQGGLLQPMRGKKPEMQRVFGVVFQFADPTFPTESAARITRTKPLRGKTCFCVFLWCKSSKHMQKLDLKWCSMV